MTSDDRSLILTELHPFGVIELSLNRPEALNAFSVDFVRALRLAVDGARDIGPAVLVVTSRCGRAFSVGADLKERAKMSADDLLACRADFVAAYRSLPELPLPVVCGLHGFAVGGGLELALTCDLIVADETAVVGLPEVTIGLIPGGGVATPRQANRLGCLRGPRPDRSTGRSRRSPEARNRRSPRSGRKGPPDVA